MGLSPATLRQEGADLIVTPNLGRLPELKELGAQWDPARRAWVLPAARWAFKWVLELLPGSEGPTEPLRAPWEDVDDARLYPYQRSGAGRLAAEPHGLLVCMSPGLGKTAVAIAAADRLVPDDQVVVVCPASLMATWEGQIRRWGTGDVTTARLHGKPDWEAAQQCRWLLTTWDTMTRHPDWFAGKWPLWIADESVLAKSRGSARTKALKRARRDVGRLWLLSGSPTTRYDDDLWAQLSALWPRAFPSYWRFAGRYCVLEDNVWSGGKVVVGTRRDRSAAEENSDLVLVVNQEDVLDLPEYLFEVVEVELTGAQRAEYLRAHTEALAGGGGETPLSRLIRLQQAASWAPGGSAKHDALVELLPTFEGPHLIWTHWRDGADALAARLGAPHVSGSTPLAERARLLDAFEAGEVPALVLSIGVGKFGHTLTAARTVHWVDKTWNADDYVQGLRRVRRIGLGHRPVSVTYHATRTTDDLVEDNLEGKLPSIARLTQSDLVELIRGLGR